MSCYESMGEPMPCAGWARRSFRSYYPYILATRSLRLHAFPTRCEDVLVVFHNGWQKISVVEPESTDPFYLSQFIIPTQRTQSTS